MQAIHVIDVKNFMQLLFQTTTFDCYEFVSAEIATDITYSLDGHFHRSFFSEEELELHHLQSSHYLSWSLAKEKVFQLIKGKKVPGQMKIILKLSQDGLASTLQSLNSSLDTSHIDGMFLNILFQENHLNVICGISYKIFTLDKELENAFTVQTANLLKSSNITCE